MKYYSRANTPNAGLVVVYFIGRDTARCKVILGKLFTPQYPKDVIVDNKTSL
jgi:hypothetical protein